MHRPPGLLLHLHFASFSRYLTDLENQLGEGRKEVFCLIVFKVEMKLTPMTQESFTRFIENKEQLKQFWHPHLKIASPASNYQDPKYLSQMQLF